MTEPVLRLFPVLSERSRGGPTSRLERWLTEGGAGEHEAGHPATKPWSLVLWLTGVDYFSTLGYQPGIALLAAGALSPLATLILVLVTLFGALPIYSAVSLRSYAGQGSIAMLETLLSGWWAKILVLVLIGFAATDFVITMTLSAADAVQHAIENPILQPHLPEGSRVLLTIALLALLTVVFLKGFTEAIGLAVFVAVPYLLLNGVVLARGLAEIAAHPDYLSRWTLELSARGDLTHVLLASVLIFPKLALGLSGFETGVAVMPLVRGDPRDAEAPLPHGRIKNTRKLLAAAALIMSLALVVSSFVTTLLIPESAYREGGPAAGRAIAYLCHEYLGHMVGTVYDISTILILWFAGASAMAGLLNLIPRYLPRFGMAPAWVALRRPLVLVLFVIDVVVTVAFKADVEAQGGAYATGVLVLMLSAAIAVALASWRDGSRTMSLAFWVISAVFAFTLVDNVIERPDGIIIASIFIFSVIILSAVSRFRRATELRTNEIDFADQESVDLWKEIVGRKVNLVPLRTSNSKARWAKTQEIRSNYKVEGPLAFINVELLDNRSDFVTPLLIRMQRDGDNYLIHVSGAIAIANTIAYVSELIDPIRIFIGLTRLNPMSQSIRYVLWGEGETGYLVYKILVAYWDWTPEDDVRPMIFLMSE